MADGARDPDGFQLVADNLAYQSDHGVVSQQFHGRGGIV
jgi:hypothetical protein